MGRLGLKLKKFRAASRRGGIGKSSRGAGRFSLPARGVGAGRGQGSLRRALAAATAVLLGVESALAQQPSPQDLADLSLEQLVEVPLLSVASKRPQAASETPSLVSVVTREEIDRLGYRTLADVLRALPGFYVSYDRNYSYVGVRGFGRPGDYNTRILLLVDGVRLNDNVYDGAYVGEELPLDTFVIERIEAWRGPGAAVYGNNAFFGVVNLVTRRGGEGPQLRAGAADQGTYGMQARYGRRFAGGGELAASASLRSSDGQALAFPEFADQHGGEVRDADGERSWKAFASFAKGGVFVEAFHSERTKHVPTAPYGTVFGDTRALTRDAYSVAALGYGRRFGANVDWTSRASFVAYDYEGTYPYALEAGEAATLYDDAGHGRWWNAETMAVVRAGRHTLMLGGELTRNARQEQKGAYAGLPDSAITIAGRGTRFGAFAQDDIALGARLRVALGARYDHHEDVGGHASPRVALIATLDQRTTVKWMYGSAYRAPNEYEQSYYEAQYPDRDPGKRRLSIETIRTLELAAERRLARGLLLSASIFSNDTRDLVTLASDSEGRLFFENSGRVRSNGGEAALEARLSSGPVGRLTYSYQRTRDAEDRRLSNSPSHLLKGSLSIPVWKGAAWASVDAQLVSSRLTLAGRESGGFVVVNATLFAARIVGGLEASASAYNLFDAAYSDPGSEEHRQDGIRQDGRSFAVKLGWSF